MTRGSLSDGLLRRPFGGVERDAARDRSDFRYAHGDVFDRLIEVLQGTFEFEVALHIQKVAREIVGEMTQDAESSACTNSGIL